MMGHDAAHSSQSQSVVGPSSTPAEVWSASGAAFSGVTIANDGTVFSSNPALGTLTAYNGETGEIKWLTLVGVNGSSTYAIGPSFTIIGVSFERDAFPPRPHEAEVEGARAHIARV